EVVAGFDAQIRNCLSQGGRPSEQLDRSSTVAGAMIGAPQAGQGEGQAATIVGDSWVLTGQPLVDSHTFPELRGCRVEAAGPRVDIPEVVQADTDTSSPARVCRLSFSQPLVDRQRGAVLDLRVGGLAHLRQQVAEADVAGRQTAKESGNIGVD